MKARTILFLALIHLGVGAQSLTNDVPLGAGGMRLVISDEPAASEARLVADNEVIADNPLVWYLHKGASVVFMGLSNSFSINLTTTNGEPITKTSKGEAMNVGPKSLTNVREGRPVRMGPGLMDYPALTNLFNFPSNGTYRVEIAYWTWVPNQNRFVLSQPVRLQVIKK